jgi:hypothetical protein
MFWCYYPRNCIKHSSKGVLHPLCITDLVRVTGKKITFFLKRRVELERPLCFRTWLLKIWTHETVCQWESHHHNHICRDTQGSGVREGKTKNSGCFDSGSKKGKL